MSLTRKFLAAMGIDEEKAEQIITAHLATVNPLKQERDELKDRATAFEDVQKQLDEAKKKVKTLEEASAGDEWKEKYEQAVTATNALKDEFESYKSDIAAKELLSQKKNAYRALLKKAGVSEKRLDAVMKVSDFDFDFENGEIKDAEKLEEAVKNEWSDFIATQEEHGASTPTPSGSDGTGTAGTPVTPRTMSRAAQLAAQYHAEHYGTKGE